MAGREQQLELKRARRQKLFVIAGGVVLLGLVGYQLPKLLSSGSKSSSPAPAAVPLARPATPATPVATPVEVAAKKAVAHLKEHDVFVSQVNLPQAASATTAVTPTAPAVREKTFVAKPDLFVSQVQVPQAASATTAVTPTAPAVREKTLVVKDPFVPQIVIPAAPIASSSGTVSVPNSDQTKVLPTKDTGGTFIVVLQVVDGTNEASLKAAARAVVAAKNAGLKDVVANDTLGPRSGPKAHFTIFTGPYTTQSGLAAELRRAHLNGYPGAYTERVDYTPVGGP